MFSKYVSNVIKQVSYNSLVGLYPKWTGFLKATPEYECKPRILDDYYLLYVSSGKGVFRCNQKEYDICEGSIFFLFPGVIHSYETDGEDLMEQWWIGFNGSAVQNVLQELGINPDLPVIYGLQNNEIAIEIRNIVSKYTEPMSYDFFKACGSLYKIFGILLHEGPSNPVDGKSEGGYSKTIQKAIHYIEANYPHCITIHQIAEDCCLSRPHFSTKFKTETGMSPSQYLSAVRLSHAKDYLANSNMSVMEISYSVGFDDTHYFSRFFKKCERLTPSEFRIRAKSGGS
jgi:AraC-like DNA-binding protein